ncbi:MAG: type II toxin-antitoxin system VapC family toxin [Campylobacterales bacterium]
MQKTLIDAGPMIALFDKSDKYHKQVVKFLSGYEGELVTTWPVVTEVSHMLDFNIKTQIDFLKWLDLGAVSIYQTLSGDIKRIIALSEKYMDVPMDLADSSLIVASEKLGIKDILTIDSDYDIYRTIKKEPLNNLLAMSK